ncbi:uncharacterized protein EV420DRAFT_1726654 [Desarmillaria tabescens]|uniref:Uncharacterized protein n=1 Tax=Armillaria tabescens TaxID=1929756 RepID=A0AA39JI25_ARMTA|nr:uncharacterized protein EV420DRAFT_1726654 [Desarmillaria tabescens]KAK0443018.1 hypothetical protein EV420DRAFT_1726654 [Desarmillaria tabescens]
MRIRLLAFHPTSQTPLVLIRSLTYFFLDEDSDSDFEISIESSVPTISGDLHGCHPYLDVGSIEDLIIGVLPIPGLYHYAVRLDYSGEQLLWLADQGPLFESAVLADCTLTFFKCLYLLWFHKWPTVDEAEREQRKIEIFTLYIMGLKYRWIDHGLKPRQWTIEQVFEKLDRLEEIITAEYDKISHVFKKH